MTTCLLGLVAVFISACAVVVPLTAAEQCASRAPTDVTLVRRNLAEGERSVAAGRFQEAIQQFNAGLAALGAMPASPASLDDTGQRIGLAAFEEKNGRLQIAAHLLRNALSTRISILERKLAGQPQSCSYPSGTPMNTSTANS